MAISQEFVSYVPNARQIVIRPIRPIVTPVDGAKERQTGEAQRVCIAYLLAATLSTQTRARHTSSLVCEIKAGFVTGLLAARWHIWPQSIGLLVLDTP